MTIPNIAQLRQLDLFRNLDAVQLAHLVSIMSEQKLTKNTVLFKEGDTPEYFYVIEKGRIRISKVIPGIGEEALAILEPGSYFGEMELLDGNQPRAAQAMVHEDCVLQAFKLSEFHELLQTEKELAVAFLWSFVRTLSDRLRATNDKMTAMFAMAQFR